MASPNTRRHVAFSRDSPPLGGRSSQRGYDSGVGSSVYSQDSHGPYPDRSYTAQDYETALRHAKDKIKELEQENMLLSDDLKDKRRDLKDRDVQWKQVCDRNRQLDEDKSQYATEIEELKKEKKEMRKDFEALRDDNASLRKQIESLTAQLSYAAPPSPGSRHHSSGSESGKLHRTSSKREKDDFDKKRLSKRFETKGKEPETSSSSKPRSSRRPSISVSSSSTSKGPYIEEYESTPRTPSQKHSSEYQISRQADPPHATMRPAVYAEVPRSVVQPVGSRPPRHAGPQEDGMYHAYALPETKQPRSSRR